MRKGYIPELSMSTSDSGYVRRKPTDYRVVISATCGSFKTHGPHIVKKGFLGIGRVKCDGYTHRHLMQLDPISLFGVGRPRFLFTVNWKCHCGTTWSVNKDGFYGELLGKAYIWYDVNKQVTVDNGCEVREDI